MIRFSGKSRPELGIGLLSKVALLALAACVALLLWGHRNFSRDFLTGRRTQPNLVLIIIDTLSASSLGAYGNLEARTPHLDRLAREGVRFERSYSAAPWTKPSIASLFTGLMPSQHGLKHLNQLFPETVPTLAESLKELGYQTGGIVSHTLIAPDSGFERGFDHYSLVKFEGNVHSAITSKLVTDDALEWLNKIGVRTAPQRPFFLMLHYFDPHFRYQHHPAFDQTSWYHGTLNPNMKIRDLTENVSSLSADDIEYLRRLHYEEISYTDLHIGRFIEELRKSKVLDQTVVVVTADHGEEFGEHGSLGHTKTLYNELIQVPLLVRYPAEFSGGRVDRSLPVSGIDLLPTLADFMNFPEKLCLKEWWGQSYLAALLGDDNSKPPPREILSEVDFRANRNRAKKIALIKENYKLIFDRQNKGYELYALNEDPLEQKNIYESEAIRAAAMKRSLTDYIRRAKTEQRPKLQTIERTMEELEQLRSLGYM